MRPPPVLDDETERLATLHELGVLDTPPEPRFNELVELAAFIAHTPIAAMTLIDEDRQWFKASIGLEIAGSTRDISFCGHTVAGDRTMVVPDTLRDERFADNPFVADAPKIRFYAGVPLSMANGHRVGTLCVLDTRPRTFLTDERRALEILGRQVEAQLYLRRTEN